VPAVHWYASDRNDAVYLLVDDAMCGFNAIGCEFPGRCLEYEHAFSLIRYQSGTIDAPYGTDSVFNLERINGASSIVNRGSTSANEPKPAFGIEVSGVPSPVPATSTHIDFRLPISDGIGIA
jgi:hypothetical protein